MARTGGTNAPGGGGMNLDALANYNPAATVFDPGAYTGPTATQAPDGSFTWTAPSSGGGGGGNPPPPPGPSAAEVAQQAYYENQTRLANEAAAAAAAARKAAQDSIIAAVTGVFNSYGMSDLVPLITQYAREGLSGDSIGILLRETPQYAKRFPAMKALQAKGRAITEGEYIGYERSAASLEQQYGLPEGMLVSNVTGLLTNEVSAAEMADRVRLASAGSILAPEDFKAQMRDRFGVDSGGLTAYYLDPTIAQPLLEKRYAMALIGTEAARAGVDGVATDYLSLLQGNGVTAGMAQQGFGRVASQEGLMFGKGEVASQDALVQTAFGTDPNAVDTVERVVKSRTAAFQGGGGFAQDRTGSSRGLGVSST